MYRSLSTDAAAAATTTLDVDGDDDWKTDAWSTTNEKPFQSVGASLDENAI